MHDSVRPAIKNGFRTLLFYMRGSKPLYITGMVLMSFSKTYAQHEADYRIQANIIYRFTKYIDCLCIKKPAISS